MIREQKANCAFRQSFIIVHRILVKDVAHSAYKEMAPYPDESVPAVGFASGAPALLDPRRAVIKATERDNMVNYRNPSRRGGRVAEGGGLLSYL